MLSTVVELALTRTIRLAYFVGTRAEAFWICKALQL